MKVRRLAAALTLSAAGALGIVAHEGMEYAPYRDIAGIWTVCAGHTGPAARQGRTLSHEVCMDLLQKDTAVAQREVQRSVKVPLTQEQFDALTSFTFNVGTGAFRTSTLLRQLNAGQCRAAGDQFLRWNKVTQNGKKVAVRGLTNRRVAERALFLTGC